MHTTLILLLLIFFLRAFIHYTGQYIMLTIMQVPITKFEFLWHRVDLEYAAWNFEQTVIVFVTGPMANTAVFGILFAIAALTRKCALMVLLVASPCAVFALVPPSLSGRK